MLQKMLSVALCAAALLLYATGYAQWPIRYNNSSQNGDDRAVAIARDHRGNVYVAGPSYGGSTDRYGYLVDSYDATGTRRSGWPVRYDGPGNGDDIPTSIHVDEDGFVYVAGTSRSSSGYYNIAVLKLTSGGQTVWPNSGSGTGYVYHNGAIRTTASIHEGATDTAPVIPQVSMVVRTDWDPANRTIAVACSRDDQMGDNGWRTYVFTQDPSSNSAPVTVKSG